MIKKLTINIVAGLLLLVPSLLFSQTGFTEYGLKGIPQSSNLNPAFKPNASLVFGLPVISSVNAGIYNTAFSFNDIFVQHPGDDSLYFNLTRPINSKSSSNYLSESFSVDLLSVGFRAGNGFMTVGIRNRVNARFYYTPDLLRFLWNGNGGYIGEQLFLSGTALYEEHFNDYYAGISFPVGYNVDVGIRAHFLQGLSNISTGRSNLTLLTEPDNVTGYRLTAQTDFSVETSGINDLLSDSTDFSPVDYFMNFGNIGYSFDVGIDARMGEQFVLQASVTDLGQLFWYGNPKNYSSSEAEVTFNGIDYDFSAENESNAFETYMDSLGNLLEVKEDARVYQSFLRTSMFLNGQYITLDEKHVFNLLFAGRFLEQSFEFALSAGYTFMPSDKFAFKLSYNYLKYAPLNLGLGFYFNFKPFQLYFTTDNVAGLFYIYGQHYADFHFGLNILIPYQYKNDIPWEHAP
jgi:hypothetical protein